MEQRSVNTDSLQILAEGYRVRYARHKKTQMDKLYFNEKYLTKLSTYIL
jgi:hypothetical protein